MKPIRINKYLADQGLTTRRAADKLIEAGKVLVNGQVAILGQKVVAGDKVEVLSHRPKAYIYLAYHKPAGETTKERYQGPSLISISRTVLDDLFPLGRLDKESRGLMILTNDGRLTDRLLNPDRDHEKEYWVTVDKPLKEGVLNHFARGMKIEGETTKTKPAKVEAENDYNFRIILTEGKKHQIRRMSAAWGYTVTDLVRLRIENVELGNLKAGETRPIVGRVLTELLSSLGLPNLSRSSK